MGSLDIVLFVIAIITIICGLLLSRSGTGSGISAVSGQDIELFKNTKSRGIIKYVEYLMFASGFACIVLAFIIFVTK